VTRNAGASGAGKERPERDARFLAWDVPGDAQIVALVHEADDAERSATVVDAIATSVARRREHTLLMSAEPGPSPLDELLGGAESEGLPAALGGRARLTDVAVQRADRPFVYLPAGQDLAAIKALLDDDVLASFVGRVRERGGTLFLVVSERAMRSQGLRELLDGYVVLGDAQVPADAQALAAFGRVRFDDPDDVAEEAGGHDGAFDSKEERSAAEPTEPEPLAEPASAPAAEASFALASEPASVAPVEPMEPASDSDDAPTFSLDSASKAETPTPKPDSRRALAGVGGGVVLVLLAGWWWFGRSPDRPTDGEPTNVALAEAAIEPPSPSLDVADAARVFAEAPVLPFSVLMASYAAKADAEEDLTRLRTRGPDRAGVFFISPTPVRGVLYHRLFAGAAANREEAVALMDRLVAAGQKDEVSAWDVRPAGAAFDLGVFVDRAAAEERVARLEATGIPSYVLTAPLDDRVVYRVYGGAYENERAALPMAELLGAIGEPASLIARQGGFASPSSTP